MPKGVPNKRYTAEFKQMVVETMQREKWSYAETERRFELPDKRAAAWERIYLAEGPEGFAIEPVSYTHLDVYKRQCLNSAVYRLFGTPFGIINHP